MNGCALPLRSEGWFDQPGSSGEALSKEAGASGMIQREWTPSASAYSLAEVQDQLLAAFIEAATPNWDGYNSRPASLISLRYASWFLAQLPSTLPEPEAATLPNGTMALEWIEGRGKRLIISFGEDGMIHFASLRGNSRLHGADQLGESIPESLNLAFSRLA